MPFSAPFRSLAIFTLGYAVLQAGAFAWLEHYNRQARVHDLGKFNRALAGELDGAVVVLGSSRAFVHYSPSVMGPILEARVVNLGVDAADTEEQDALHLLVAEFNRPRLVVLNLDSAGLDPEIMTFHTRNMTPFFFSHAGIRRRLVKNDIYNLKYWLSPASAFHLSYGVSGLLDEWPQDMSDEGAMLQERTWDGSFDQWLRDNPEGRTYDIHPSRWEALEQIAKRAAGPGQPLMVWMISPELAEWQQMARQRDAIVERMRTLAESNGIVWMDFSGPDCHLCQDRANFYNSQHLRRPAAEIFSAQAAEALKPLLPPQ